MGLGGIIVGGHAGALVIVGHQDYSEFIGFHTVTLAIFFVELVVWEFFSSFTQVHFCKILLNNPSKKTKFLSRMCDQSIYNYLDGF